MKSSLLLLSTLLICSFHLAQDSTALYPYRSGEKWGFCNYKGIIQITPEYDSVSSFYKHYISGAYWAKTIHKGKEGYIGPDNEYIIPPKYHTCDIGYAQDDYFYIVSKKGKYGVTDKEFNKVIPLKYDEIFKSDQDLYGEGSRNNFYCKEGGKILKIDISKPDEVIEVKNTTEKKLKEPVYLMEDDGYDYGGYKKSTPPPLPFDKFKEIHKTSIDSISTEKFEHKYYKVYFKNKVGLVHKDEIKNLSSDFFLPTEFDDIYKVSNYRRKPLIIASKNGKHGVIDYSQKTLVPFVYDSIVKYFIDAVIVENNGNFGVYHLELKEVIKPKYKTLKFLSSHKGVTLLTTFDHDHKDLITSFGAEFFED